MTWVEERYKNPTKAQLLAEKAKEMLNEIDVECVCEYGEPAGYFAWPDEGPLKGKMVASYVPVTKTCKKCKLANILWEIADPDDMSGVFT